MTHAFFPLIIALIFFTLTGFGWSVYALLNGPKTKIKRRMAAFAVTKSKELTPKRRALIDRLPHEEMDKERGYRLREQMLQAGLEIKLWQFLSFCTGLSIAIFAVILIVAHKPLAALLNALIFGVGGPKIILGIMAKRRVRLFSEQLADSIDIVVRGIRSGLPLGECINIIAREMQDPIKAEFRLMAEGQKLGLSLQDVLKRSVERMPVAELRYFSIVIAIQQQTGGNLADTLAKLSEVLRARKRMREKVQAYASEAKASAMIIGALPFVVMALLAVMSPKYLAVLFTTDPGNIILFMGAMTEIIGIFVMRQMINFEV